MKKIFLITLVFPILFVIIAIAAFFSSPSSDLEFISEKVKVNVENGELVQFVDDVHFRGEGVQYAIIKFEDDSIKNKIEKQRGWNAFPMSTYLEEYINCDYCYKCEGKDFYVKDFFPIIENGYYFIFNLSGGDIWTELFNPGYYYDNSDEVLKRRYDLIVSIYDVDENLLYYFYCAY